MGGLGLERFTVALRTPQGRCASTPPNPPFARGGKSGGPARFLSPPCEGGGRGVLRQRTSSVCNPTVKRSKGNVLDLWAAIHRLPLYEAALHLAETFNLPRSRGEEPV